MNHAPETSRDLAAHWLILAPAVVLYAALASTAQHLLAIVFVLLATKFLDALESRHGQRLSFRLIRPAPVFLATLAFTAETLPLAQIGIGWSLTACLGYATLVCLLSEEFRGLRLVITVLSLLAATALISLKLHDNAWFNAAMLREAVLFLIMLELVRPQRPTLQWDALATDFTLSATVALVATFALDSWPVALCAAVLPTVGLLVQNHRRSLAYLGYRLDEEEQDDLQSYGRSRRTRQRAPTGAFAGLGLLMTVLALLFYFSLAYLPSWTAEAKRSLPLLRYLAFQSEQLAEQSQLNRPELERYVDEQRIRERTRQAYDSVRETLLQRPAPTNLEPEQDELVRHLPTRPRPLDSRAASSAEPFRLPEQNTTSRTRPHPLENGSENVLPTGITVTQSRQQAVPATPSTSRESIDPPLVAERPNAPKSNSTEQRPPSEQPRQRRDRAAATAPQQDPEATEPPKQENPLVETELAEHAASPDAASPDAKPTPAEDPIPPSAKAPSGPPAGVASSATASTAVSEIPKDAVFATGPATVAGEQFSIDHVTYRQANDTVLMKVALLGRSDVPRLLYLRTGVLDTITPDGLDTAPRNQVTLPLELNRGNTPAPKAFTPTRRTSNRIRITASAPLEGPLPIPEGFRSISVPSENSLSYNPLDRLVFLNNAKPALQYELSGVDFDGPASPDAPRSALPAIRERFSHLPLPGDEVDYLQSLARAVSPHDPAPQALAASLSIYFARYHPYSHQFELPTGDQHSAVRWLRNRASGICTHYTSAFTVLARSQSIPTRIVTGYLTYEYNEEERSFVVRAANAHAWVEYLDESNRWVRFDPTSPTAAEDVKPSLPGADLTTIAKALDQLDAQTPEVNRTAPQGAEPAAAEAHAVDISPALAAEPLAPTSPQPEASPAINPTLERYDAQPTKAAPESPEHSLDELAAVALKPAAKTTAAQLDDAGKRERNPIIADASSQTTPGPLQQTERSATSETATGESPSVERHSEEGAAIPSLEPVGTVVPAPTTQTPSEAGRDTPADPPAQPEQQRPPAANLLIALAIVLAAALGLPSLVSSLTARAQTEPENRYRHVAGRLLNKVEQLIRERDLQEQPDWEHLREELVRQRYGRRVDPVTVEHLSNRFRQQRSAL